MHRRVEMKMGLRVVVLLALLLAGAVVLLGGGQPASAGVPVSTAIVPVNAAAKIEAKALQDTANGKTGSFAVFLADQADLSAAYKMKDQDARGWYVYNTLKSHAEKSQAALRAQLDAQGVPYQAFWVANVIFVNGDRTLVNSLAARNDVKLIESNAEQRWIEDPKIADIHMSPQNNSPNTIEYGVANVNAPQVWAMGFTGQGIVIGNADTGMQWDHPAIKPHYRGWNGTTADHNYNWHDSIHDSTGNPCGNDAQAPCDDQGHGTHTTGTTSGDDGAGNQIGVAPGAKWIGCHNMDRGNGTPARYSECFQFFIAPTDLNNNNPNPALRPHVINNSWECPASEGCAAATLQTIVENTQAAGIFVEASAQNSGPNCSTVQNPPAIYDAAFSTGAYDISNALAGFSSRGPVTADGSNRIKPNISAPGVSNRSSYPTNSYALLSGTSMAGPHVVGVVALLWSARPALVRDIATTKSVLQNSANPNVTVSATAPYCGDTPPSTIPNNYFGYGRVDALAAVNSVTQGTPTTTATATPPTATQTRTTIPSTNTATAVSDTPTTGAGTSTPLITATIATSVPTRTATAGIGGPTRTPTSGIATATSIIPLPTLTIVIFPSNTVAATTTVVASTTAVATNTITATGTAVASTTSVSSATAGASTTPVASTTAIGTAGATNTVGPAATATSTSVQPTPTVCSIRFADVPATGPGSTFYSFIRCLACRQIIGGYPCGGAVEPCNGSNDPYFRPGFNVTRGQISKMVALSANLTAPGPTPAQIFEDVAPSNNFYNPIEALAMRGYIGGYACGGPGEPCGSGNRPYFRPSTNTSRGQLSKIVSETAQYNDDPGAQRFTDVASNSPFYMWIQRLSIHSVIDGYACGGPGEPCDSQNRPYFRPNALVTRGQTTKIVGNTFFPGCVTPARR